MNLPFSFIPDSRLTRTDVIALPEKVMATLGVLAGQRLQVQTTDTLFLLRIIPTAAGEEARVAPTVFELLQKAPCKYEVPPVTLGCDPEFFMLEGRRFTSAAAYLPYLGQVGCDGHLGELRPNYGIHEDQVVENLRRLINSIPTHVGKRNLTFEGHSFFNGLPAGFHVHLGLPPELVHTKHTFHKTAVEHLIRCLDWYVSGLLAHIEVARQSRCGRNGYGLPGDYRMSNFTVEYRTPGGFFLRDPVMAAGLMGISLLVTKHFVNRLAPLSNNFLDLDKVEPNTLQEALPIPRPLVVRAALMDPTKKVLIQAMPRILATLQAMPEYGEHKKSIEEFVKVVESGIPPSPNLSANWRK